MATNVRQFLRDMCRRPPVHKWEKRWVSKGNVMVYKWVRTSVLSGDGTAEPMAPFPDSPIDAGEAVKAGDDAVAANAGRRLTRGKAEAMGITVEAIADTNDSGFRPVATAPGWAAPPGGVRKESGVEGGGDREGEGETSRKRAREDVADGDSNKEARIGGTDSMDVDGNRSGGGES